MGMNEYLVSAVLEERRSVAEVAAAHDVTRAWIYELLKRYRERGPAGLEPRSRRPHSSPGQVSDAVEDAVIAMRKHLQEIGVDAGACTIHFHLAGELGEQLPSETTIHRILCRRGFITPEPHKRPKSSLRRFAAELPNETWQTDITHWQLADGSEVEIMNIIDDHSRLLIASHVLHRYTALSVLRVFLNACKRWGEPQSLLSDNGAVFTANYRNGVTTLETHLSENGIVFKHSKPYHPQTCGKVERFHQTLKNYLATRPARTSIRGLQADLDRFAEYYNNTRPHRSLGRLTPASVYAKKTKAKPSAPKINLPAGYRRLNDIVDKDGKLSIRYRSEMRHLGVGATYRGIRVIKQVRDRNIRVINAATGELIGEYLIDPKKNYQQRIRTAGSPR